jgi:hypothetical protein
MNRDASGLMKHSDMKEVYELVLSYSKHTACMHERASVPGEFCVHYCSIDSAILTDAFNWLHY